MLCINCILQSVIVKGKDAENVERLRGYPRFFFIQVFQIALKMTSKFLLITFKMKSKSFISVNISANTQSKCKMIAINIQNDIKIPLILFLKRNEMQFALKLN